MPQRSTGPYTDRCVDRSLLDPEKKRLVRITTVEHLTPYLRDEVTSLGYQIQEQDAVAVHLGGTLEDCMRLCLHLRTAFHVLWLLKRFRCPSPKALYTHAASFPWEELIANDGFVCVTSNVDNPKISNTMYPNLVVKDAIVDRISKQTGARPDSGSDRSKVVIHLDWKGDRAWLYLNVNGLRLADRGYRRIPHSAPMRETLAAAVVLATGYDGTQALVNPMCGSGTIAIEAALIAANRPPGLLRANFGFMHTLLYDEPRWQAVRRAARKQRRVAPELPIIASDIDPQAIEAARANARTAGVEQLVDFVTCDFAATPMPATTGIVILNPEYGERLGEVAALEPVYARIGDFFKQRLRRLERLGLHRQSRAEQAHRPAGEPPDSVPQRPDRMPPARLFAVRGLDPRRPAVRSADGGVAAAAGEGGSSTRAAGRGANGKRPEGEARRGGGSGPQPRIGGRRRIRRFVKSLCEFHYATSYRSHCLSSLRRVPGAQQAGNGLEVRAGPRRVPGNRPEARERGRQRPRRGPFRHRQEAAHRDGRWALLR